MTETQARDEICRIGRSLFERGYVHATAGNISVRLDDRYLITPTDACLGFLDPAQLALIDASGQQIGGDTASKTFYLHRRIYQATAATNQAAACVIHTHSTHLVALSLLGLNVAGPCGHTELLPPITPYYVMKVGHVPHMPYARPGSPQAADAVVQAISDYAAHAITLRAVMLERLGPNVWHQTPSAAMAVLEELEETARLWLLTQQRPTPLGASAIQELSQAFKAQW
jgi:3-dehydro-4-phosphotetronate decarboxylase